MAFAFVYTMTSRINGAVYVGVTSDPGARFTIHRNTVISGTHQCPAVRREFAGHQKDDVLFAVVHVFELPREINAKCAEANKVEHYFIKRLGAINQVRDVRQTKFADADWSKNDAQLARQYGVSHQRIQQVRLSLGFPLRRPHARKKSLPPRPVVTETHAAVVAL